MKPFDLEQAKAGSRVMCRNGSPVRIVCFDRLDSDRPLVGVMIADDGMEHVMTFRADGKYCTNGKSSYYDLFMAPVKREGWANLYPTDRPHAMARSGAVYDSEKLANESAQPDRIACIHIEWEE